MKSTTAIVLLLASLLGGAASGALAAAEPGNEARLPDRVQEADLGWTEVGYSFFNAHLDFTPESNPFPKEPAANQGKIIRGRFMIAGSAANATAFLWLPAARKLYVDLNRNLDLTDDGAGGFTIAPGTIGNASQVFNRIALPLAGAADSRRAVVDLTIIDSPKRSYCYVALRSLWLGRVTLQGDDWQIGVVENPFVKAGAVSRSHVLLRPWAERQRPFNAYEGSLDAFPYGPKLFVGQRTYEFQVTATSTGGAEVLRMQLTAKQPVLGELKITGEFIERLTLAGGPSLVVLDRPGAVIRVPVGSYQLPTLSLKHGPAAATHRDFTRPAAAAKITIGEASPAILVAGGPLKNTVSATRQGRRLYLKHELVGAGGEIYTLGTVDRAKPPEFVVDQAGRKVGTGRFEFG